MSTHYGRMIHQDDRTIMFANPEDAAEYLGFDLTPASAASAQRLAQHTRFGPRGGTVYEKDGEKYFVVDSHMHYWNAAPDNWVPGAEQYAKGWIECFHAYQGLGPPETHWSIEHFQKYSEDDLMKDVFEDGLRRRGDLPADVPEGVVQGGLQHHRAQRADGRAAPRQVHRYNTRFDPRDGDAGLQGARGTTSSGSGPRACKLYTAEWNNGSRGWKLTDPGAYRYLEACQELGIKNIHVHKGPTIWPLDKDAFDVSDVDHAATDFPGLNFIVEHVGLPRIEDFCFMATQEPNVYAGLSVVIGGLMHARPKFFAKVHGRAAVLGRRGQDDLRQRLRHLGAPKWQVEGFVDWDYPTRGVLRLPAGDHGDQEEDPRPERGQALRHRGAGRVPARRCRPAHARGRARAVTRRQSRGASPCRGRRPRHRRGCSRRWRRCATRSWTSRSPRSASSRRAPSPRTGTRRSGCGCPPTSARPTSPS